MKKILSLVVLVIVVLSGFTGVFAAEEETSGDLYFMISQVDNNLLFVNGMPTEFDPINPEVMPAKNENGDIFVPVYMTVGCAGGYTTWEQETNSVLINYNGETITFVIGSDEVKVGEETVKLSAPTYAENNRTLVPLDFFVSCLNGTQEVDTDTNTIIIALETKVYAAG